MHRRIIDHLGVPSVSDENLLIYQGDCLALMRHLPPEIIDLTITSPPYNIGKEYEKTTGTAEYVSWCSAWLEEISRVTKPSGSMWLNLGYTEVPGRAKALPISYLLWQHIPFYILQEVVWNYGAGVASKKSFSPRNEKLLFCVKNSEKYTFNLDSVRDPDVKYPNQKKNGKLKCNPLGKNPSDVWQIPKVTSGANRSSKERTSHPAQFPMALVERAILASSNEGDWILDPFMGSGTVGEAALRLNRKVLGFEIRPDYIEIISERIQYLHRQREQSAWQNTLSI